jgi:hypothetical protein
MEILKKKDFPPTSPLLFFTLDVLELSVKQSHLSLVPEVRTVTKVLMGERQGRFC